VLANVFGAVGEVSAVSVVISGYVASSAESTELSVVATEGTCVPHAVMPRTSRT